MKSMNDQGAQIEASFVVIRIRGGVRSSGKKTGDLTAEIQSAAKQ